MAKQLKPEMKAVIYVRISKDRDEQTSTDSQERVCRSYVESKGWTVVSVEVDKGRSAFKAEGKRPGLDRAMKLVETGAADVLVVWKLDRFVRSVAHFGKLWPRLQDADASFVSVTEAFDTTTAMGRAMLQIAVVFAELESAFKSERIGEWHEERRIAGRQPTGPRPYGYRRTGDGFVLDTKEAKTIRTAAARIGDGDSLRSIVATLNDAGTPTSTGKRWSNRGLRHILTSPTTAGLRDVDGLFVDGSWPPILDRATWDAMRDRLLDPRRRTNTSNQARWMLTSIATCARCGDSMRAKPHNAGTRYTCRSCSLSAPAEAVDALVSGALVDLIDGDLWSRLRAAGRAPGVDVEALEGELAELAQMYAAGDLTIAEWKTMRQGITDRAANAAAEPIELPDVADLGSSWESFSVEAKQLVIDAVVSSITIAPAVPGANRFDPNRVEVEWKV